MTSQKIKKIKVKTFNQLLKDVAVSETFVDTYNEELFRFKIAKQIKTLRSESNLTQEGFAKKAQMPQSVIARIESGRHTVSLVTLNKVAHALGKSVEIV